MREHEFKPYEKVLVRDYEDSYWRADLFSHSDEANKLFICVGHQWSYCIPYEGNEHLLGTTDSPTPGPEFKFGDKVEVRDNIEEPWKKGIFKCRQNQQYLSFIVLTENYDCPAGWRYCRHADW